MKKEEKIFTLRIDNDIFEACKFEAYRNKRSISKEIEYVLENYYGLANDVDVVPDDFEEK